MLYPDTTSSLTWILCGPALCIALVPCPFLSEMQSKSLIGHSENNGNLSKNFENICVHKRCCFGWVKMCSTSLMYEDSYLSPVCRIVSFGELALNMAIFSMPVLVPEI